MTLFPAAALSTRSEGSNMRSEIVNYVVQIFAIAACVAFLLGVAIGLGCVAAWL